MRRHPALIPLSRFHKRVLFTAQLAKKNSPPYPDYPQDAEGKRDYVIRFLRSHLKDHMELEEKHLLPHVENRHPKLKTLAEQIKMEHKSLTEMVQKLHDSDELVEDLNEFGVLLEQHVRKEERQFFQLIQEVLTEEELKEIVL